MIKSTDTISRVGTPKFDVRQPPRTFDAGQVYAGVLVNTNTVPDDSQTAFLERPGASHKLHT